MAIKFKVQYNFRPTEKINIQIDYKLVADANNLKNNINI